MAAYGAQFAQSFIKSFTRPLKHLGEKHKQDEAYFDKTRDSLQNPIGQVEKAYAERYKKENPHWDDEEYKEGETAYYNGRARRVWNPETQDYGFEYSIEQNPNKIKQQIDSVKGRLAEMGDANSVMLIEQLEADNTKYLGRTNGLILTWWQILELVVEKYPKARPFTLSYSTIDPVPSEEDLATLFANMSNLPAHIALKMTETFWELMPNMDWQQWAMSTTGRLNEQAEDALRNISGWVLATLDKKPYIPYYASQFPVEYFNKYPKHYQTYQNNKNSK